jgi:hypothetical protein
MRTKDGIDVIERLDAAATELATVDLSELSDVAIEESLSVLSIALCHVDVLLSRLADETQCRGYAAVEFPWFGVDPADIRRTDAEVARMDALPLAS